MDYLNFQNIEKDPVKTRSTELVERKGIGHPDSICDGIAESVSRALSREYRERFGEILHHNTDEAQLVAGASNPAYGGGETIEPIYILLTGRATKSFGGDDIPVDSIALKAAKDYISRNFKKLNPEFIEFESKIGETSTDLKSVFDSSGVPKSNDTSFGVGHYPYSETEKIVRNLEHQLHGRIDGVGEDVKVMGLRNGDRIILTVAAAAIDEHVENLEEYTALKRKIYTEAKSYAESRTDREVEVHVNTADIPEEGSVYMTVTGTSAEMGDDGSVGRGNRVNGMITPHRSMSMEAASGKNPMTHVGKIYNLLSSDIAKAIYEETSEYAGVKIVSQIGKPINEPQALEVETTSSDQEAIRTVIQQKLDNIQDITDRVVNGDIKTF